MKTLLISIQRDLDIIGLKQIHHVLLGRGHESRLLFAPQFSAARTADAHALTAFIEAFQPQLIGISLMSLEFAWAKDITLAIKAQFPAIPVVWGGIHPTSDPESCFGLTDFVCVGEGEQAMLAAANAVETGGDLKATPNFGWREEDGTCRQNPVAPLLKDLDTLPALRRIAPESWLLAGGKVVPIDETIFRRHARHAGRNYITIASRGCPFSCAYCCNSLYRKMYPDWGVRRRGVEHIIGELEQALHDFPGVEYVNFHDDCFLACDMEFLRSFCAEYKRRINRPLVAKSAPNYVTRERLDLLKDAGLSWLSLGLQSGSPVVCRDVYLRKSKPEDFIRAAKLIKEYGIAPFYDVILDNPFESEEEQLQTVETLIETPKPYYPEIFSLVFYPGTQLRERALAECPDQMDDPTTKDYRVRHHKLANDLIEIATTLHAPLMRRLLARYRRAPESRMTKVLVGAAKLYSRLVLTPVTYLRVIRISQGGSWLRAFRVLPNYLKVGLEYYLDLFATHRGGEKS